ADMDEWLAASASQKVPPPSTFAFPWRSSNSLTPEFYETLYNRGIRAVTRIYERDLRDLYSVSAVPAYTQMLVLPDFRLEAPTGNVVDEAAGGMVSLEQGRQVLDEVIARRGTTSFWTHPEQLAPGPEYDAVRSAWRGVVSDAAARRDLGQLYIGTVAEITAYQRDIMSVTTSLQLAMSGWTLRVTNGTDHVLHGVTITLPSEVSSTDSTDVVVSTVDSTRGGEVRVNKSAEPHFPVRRIVLAALKPGTSVVRLSWAPGQEPPR
ncbi:MAG TPA: hypothetical protein VM409_01075, partial [Chloroflexia bacterium]|nr:hypothetical protein [Chloroflexia bacterium]